jgi:hypothetical protein
LVSLPIQPGKAVAAASFIPISQKNNDKDPRCSSGAVSPPPAFFLMQKQIKEGRHWATSLYSHTVNSDDTARKAKAYRPANNNFME